MEKSKIQQWLDERIAFTDTVLTGLSNNPIDDNMKSTQIGRFTIANHDFKYCKELYDKIIINNEDIEAKTNFKKLSERLIFSTIEFFNQQLNETIRYHGFMSATKERDEIPQKMVDAIEKDKKFMEEVFNEVQLICN